MDEDRFSISAPGNSGNWTPRMGLAQRLPNRNTLIIESSFGRFFEVTK